MLPNVLALRFNAKLSSTIRIVRQMRVAWWEEDSLPTRINTFRVLQAGEVCGPTTGSGSIKSTPLLDPALRTAFRCPNPNSSTLKPSKPKPYNPKTENLNLDV